MAGSEFDLSLRFIFKLVRERELWQLNLLLVICLAWPQARSQAKPGPEKPGWAGPKPSSSQNIWPGFGFWKPKPGLQAQGFEDVTGSSPSTDSTKSYFTNNKNKQKNQAGWTHVAHWACCIIILLSPSHVCMPADYLSASSSTCYLFSLPVDEVKPH